MNEILKNELYRDTELFNLYFEYSLNEQEEVENFISDLIVKYEELKKSFESRKFKNKFARPYIKIKYKTIIDPEFVKIFLMILYCTENIKKVKVDVDNMFFLDEHTEYLVDHKKITCLSTDEREIDPFQSFVVIKIITPMEINENKMKIWNPWHGCKKISEGCKNCYVWRIDKVYGRNPEEFKPTSSLNMPTEKWKKGENKGNYKLNDDSVLCCITSDFFIENADGELRDVAWKNIKERNDILFTIITKRIDRLKKNINLLPKDWGLGYDNVRIFATVENQENANKRISVLLSQPIKYRGLCIEPMLEKINIEKYLSTGLINQVICGGESGGKDARPLNIEWIIDLQKQCKKHKILFCFKQTGSNFINENGILKTYSRNKMIKRAKEYKLNDFEIY